MKTPATLPCDSLSILGRLISNQGVPLSVAAARDILKIDFTDGDRQRMRELSQKARDGTLSADERTEIGSYELVGHLLALMHSKARQSLKKRRRTGA